MVLAPLGALALCAAIAAASDAVPMLDLAVARADLIVVARVVGMIDTKPQAQARRHLEAHWIVVEKTLMGHDETGQRLRARPQGLRWEAGRSYVLFLEVGEDDSVTAVPQPLTEATVASVASVREHIAAQGGAVQPARVIWIRYDGGWGAGLLAEFGVASDGRFEYRVKRAAERGDAPEEVWAGTLPAESLADLVRQIEDAGEAPSADDAGQVSIRWATAGGGTRRATWWLPQEPPASTLLEAVDRLARRYGRPRR
jgi:hypothetical protein